MYLIERTKIFFQFCWRSFDLRGDVKEIKYNIKNNKNKHGKFNAVNRNLQNFIFKNTLSAKMVFDKL